MFALIQTLRRAVSLRILLLPALLLVAALALAGGADEIITTVYTDYTELSLPVPGAALLRVQVENSALACAPEERAGDGVQTTRY